MSSQSEILDRSVDDSARASGVIELRKLRTAKWGTEEHDLAERIDLSPSGPFLA